MGYSSSAFLVGCVYRARMRVGDDGTPGCEFFVSKFRLLLRHRAGRRLVFYYADAKRRLFDIPEQHEDTPHLPLAMRDYCVGEAEVVYGEDGALEKAVMEWPIFDLTSRDLAE